MKKIIKITESELNRIIRKVISEQQYAQGYERGNPAYNMSPGFQDLGSASFENPEDRKPAYTKPKVKSTDAGILSGANTDRIGPYAPVKKGSKGPQVSKFQLALLNGGYRLGPRGADGDFGSFTELAVLEFQRDNGIRPTGVIDQRTATALTKKMNQKNSAGKFNDKLNQATKLPKPEAATPPMRDKNVPVPPAPLKPEWQQDRRES